MNSIYKNKYDKETWNVVLVWKIYEAVEASFKVECQNLLKWHDIKH